MIMGSAPVKADVQQETNAARIEQEIAKERAELHKTLKLLLLGPSEVGKSTILKQIRILHSKGFSEQERRKAVPLISLELLRGIQLLARELYWQKKTFADPGCKVHLETINQELERRNESDLSVLSTEVVAAILALMNDATVEQHIRSLNGIAKQNPQFYYMCQSSRITQQDYTPSDADMLNLRVQTTGVVTITIRMKTMTLRVIDVGGQKALRRKWIHSFENVNAVVFLSALSDYCLFMPEDEKMNRMVDTVQLCTDIFNSRWLANATLFLFLNKKDVFEEQLKTVPVKTHFPEYKGKNNFAEAADFFEDKLVRCCSNVDRRIYRHRTCATDTHQMKTVIDTCLGKIMDDNLANTGLKPE